MKAESRTATRVPAGSQQALDAVGVGKTHENGDSNHENGANGGKHQHDLIGRTRIGAPGQSETDDDRDGPGPGRKRQSQRMEGLIEWTGQRPFLLRGFQVLLATLLSSFHPAMATMKPPATRRTGIEMP